MASAKDQAAGLEAVQIRQIIGELIFHRQNALDAVNVFLPALCQAYRTRASVKDGISDPALLPFDGGT